MIIILPHLPAKRISTYEQDYLHVKFSIHKENAISMCVAAMVCGVVNEIESATLAPCAMSQLFRFYYFFSPSFLVQHAVITFSPSTP